jgi:hypothetical protein
VGDDGRECPAAREKREAAGGQNHIAECTRREGKQWRFRKRKFSRRPERDQPATLILLEELSWKPRP